MARATETLRNPGAHRHVVQVYRDEGFLVRGVAAWLHEPLSQGGGTVLACTMRHARLILAQLRKASTAAEAALVDGRLVVLDAEASLARIMEGNEPSRDKFASLLEPVILAVRAACRPGAEVRAWGEMVDLLWKRSNVEGARRIERYWNDLIDASDIRLLCSYEFDTLMPATEGPDLHDVCAGHSLLVSEEDESAFDTAVAAALVEVYGEDRAPLLRSSWSAKRLHATSMSPALTVLSRAQEEDPEGAPALFEAVRKNLSERSS